MPYLTPGQNEFEQVVNRWNKRRSAQLDKTVNAVKKYVQTATADNLRGVGLFYTGWRNQQPTEFDERALPLQKAFEKELLQEYRRFNIRIDADLAAPAQAPALGIAMAPAVAINRWTSPKRGAKLGLAGASLGVSIAQDVTGAGYIAAATGAAAAVSATGVGLIVTAVGLTVTTSVLATRSAWKTKKHLDGLQDIYDKRDSKSFSDPQMCQMANRVAKTQDAYVGHDMIANLVLPYIIHKKDAKYKRKIVTAVPFLGTLETARAIGKKIYKYASGTLGVNRKNAASWLACHLISCDCVLVQAIVSELYSVGEMEWLKYQKYGIVTEYLEQKLKST